MTTTTVLIAEFGARWDESATTWCGPGRQLIVLAQHAREAMQDFCSRVDASLDRLQRSHVQLRRIVVVPAEQYDGDAGGLMRLQTLRLVLDKLEQGEGSKPLLLSAVVERGES